jgi:dTDP-4-dehydrorhamnose reductase
VLLTGANGMLGQALSALRPPGIDLIALGRAHLDIGDRARVFDVVRDIQPDWIINAAAYTAVDRAENEEAKATRINGDAVGYLAEAALRSSAGVIHFGSDYIFDGRSMIPYDEDAEPNPLSAYGRSKLRGELLLRSSGARYLIIRTQWLFGLAGRSFPLTMWNRATQGQVTRVVADQFGSPTSATDLASAAWTLLGTEGTLHVVNDGVASWFDVAAQVFEAAGARHLLRPCGTEDYPVLARRPAFSPLASSRFQGVAGAPLRHWSLALNDLVSSLTKWK